MACGLLFGVFSRFLSYSWVDFFGKVFFFLTVRSENPPIIYRPILEKTPHNIRRHLKKAKLFKIQEELKRDIVSYVEKLHSLHRTEMNL